MDNFKPFSKENIPLPTNMSVEDAEGARKAEKGVAVYVNEPSRGFNFTET